MSASLRSLPLPQPGRLEASAQLLDIEPGLYSVEIACTDITRARDGLLLPCIRLDPVTPTMPGGGRAYMSALADGAMIMPGAEPGYLRVRGGKASVVLTIYKSAGSSAKPDVRVRLIGNPAPAPAASEVPQIRSLPLSVLAHVQRSGDVTADAGNWVGQPGSLQAIEGFSISPGEGIGEADIEYQAVLGTDWASPWVQGGAFCGSRGLALPLLGVRIRLRDAAAARFQCLYWGSFAGQGTQGPVRDGAVCAGQGAPLEALRVVIAPRAPVDVTAMPAKTARKARQK